MGRVRARTELRDHVLPGWSACASRVVETVTDASHRRDETGVFGTPGKRPQGRRAAGGAMSVDDDASSAVRRG